jgi:hypothetical protein
MTDLETKLAEGERLIEGGPSHHANLRIAGFDAAAAIAREVVAKKDAEILRLKRELDRRPFLEPDEHIGKDSEVMAREAEIARLEAVVAEKDAQIKALAGPMGRVLVKLGVLRDDVSLTGPDLIVAAEAWLEAQSTDEPAAK